MGSPLLAETCFQLAKTFHLSDNFDNAASYYEKAMELADVHRDSVLLSKVLTSYGILRIRNGLNEDGERNILKAIEIAKRTRDLETEANCYGHLGESKYFLGEYASSIEHYRKSAELADELGITTLLSACYNNIGQCYAELGRYREAETYIRQAIAWRVHDRQERYINEYFTNLAYLHIREGDARKTLQVQIDHFALLSDSALGLDAAALEPQHYIHEQLLDMHHTAEAALAEAQYEASGKAGSATRWKYTALLLLLPVAGLGWLAYRQRSRRTDTQPLSGRGRGKSATPSLSEAVTRFNTLMQQLQDHHNPVLPMCFMFMSYGYSYADIGRAIARDASRVTRYVSDMADVLGMTRNEVRDEAVRLGRIIWASRHHRDPSHAPGKFAHEGQG